MRYWELKEFMLRNLWALNFGRKGGEGHVTRDGFVLLLVLLSLPACILARSEIWL